MRLGFLLSSPLGPDFAQNEIGFEAIRQPFQDGQADLGGFDASVGPPQRLSQGDL